MGIHGLSAMLIIAAYVKNSIIVGQEPGETIQKENSVNYKDHPVYANAALASEMILELVEDKEKYLQLLEALRLLGLLDENYVCRPHGAYKCRSVLLGVIYTLIRIKFIKPNLMNEKHHWQALSDSQKVSIMVKCWKLNRSNRVSEPKDKLIELALERVPLLREWCAGDALNYC